jgi:hypothetical protein
MIALAYRDTLLLSLRHGSTKAPILRSSLVLPAFQKHSFLVVRSVKWS